MSTLAEFSKMIIAMPYRDLKEIADELVLYDLTEDHEFANALLAVAESFESSYSGDPTMPLMQFANVINSLSYRDLKAVTEKLTYHPLDEWYEVSDALISVAEDIFGTLQTSNDEKKLIDYIAKQMSVHRT